MELTCIYGSSRWALGHDFLHENALLETAVHLHPQSGKVGATQRDQPRSGRLFSGDRKRNGKGGRKHTWVGDEIIKWLIKLMIGDEQFFFLLCKYLNTSLFLWIIQRIRIGSSADVLIKFRFQLRSLVVIGGDGDDCAGMKVSAKFEEMAEEWTCSEYVWLPWLHQTQARNIN